MVPEENVLNGGLAVDDDGQGDLFVIDEVKRVINLEGLKQAHVAKQLGVSPSALSQTLKHEYKGNTRDVVAKMRAWLQARERRDGLVGQLPGEPAWFEGPTAAQILQRLQLAHMTGNMAAIVGIPGASKSKSAARYRELNPNNVWIATMTVFTKGALQALDVIARAVGVKDLPKGNHAHVIAEKVAKQVSGTGGLLIVDEAHLLTREALDGVRGIYDATGVAICLIGNEELDARMQGKGRGEFAQLTSRVGITWRIKKVKEGDVVEQARAWGITGQAEIDYLHAIARKPGALRGINQTIRFAQLLAHNQGGAIDVTLLRQAFAQHHGEG